MYPFPPTADGAFAAAADTFADLLVADPARYGIAAAEAASVRTKVDEYLAAKTITDNPTTRTTPAITEKDAQKAEALSIVRSVARRIKMNLGVAPEDITGLGMDLNDPTPTPIAAPATSPILSPIAGTPGEITLRYADQNTPDSRKRPAHADGLQLYVSVGTVAATDPTQCVFEGLVTRQPFAVVVAPANRGKVFTFAGRWYNRKGEVGPWSNLATFTGT